MLVDRHSVAALLALSQVSEAERVAHQGALEVLLVRLFQSATPAGREAFLKRMELVPKNEKPWGALVRPSPAQWIGLGPPVPAVALLVRGQQDDDPDSAEDGNRLPDRDSKEGEPWGSVYAALDRWDTQALLQHIGPAGWQVRPFRPVPLDEGYAVELVRPNAVFNTTPAPAPAETSPTEAPAPANGAATPVPTATPTPPWRHPAVLGGAVAGGLLLVYALARPRATPLPEMPS